MSTNKNPILYLLPETQEAQLKTGRVFMYLYNDFFHAFYINEKIDTELLLKELYRSYPEAVELHKHEFRNKENNETKLKTEKVIIKLKEKVLLEIRNNEAAIFHQRDEDIEVYKEFVNSFIKQKEEKKSFNLIVSCQYASSGLDVEEFEITKRDVDIFESYNDDFLPFNYNVIQFLKADNKSGLVLLHGLQGTGKTTYIRHLINNIEKKFIYLQAQMVNEITKPGFLPFMKEHKESILIIEDCEDLIQSRETNNGSGAAISNLLNIGDGLLSDALSLKVICTFNTDLRNIDKAILRKGRLKGKYEFKELAASKVEKILNKMEIYDIEPRPMTLAEIYNITDNQVETEQYRKAIGFR